MKKCSIFAEKIVTMEEIKLNDILHLSDEEIMKYKLHLAATSPDGVRPLDVFIRDKEEWKGWNEYKGDGKNVWTRDYIFTLIPDYHKANKYIFGGVFKVEKRLKDSYEVSLTDQFCSLIGRLVVDFYRYPGMMGRAFYLESFLEKFIVTEILDKPYAGVNFPGYDNINIDFSSLEFIINNQKQDWKVALENVKGVYLIVDKKNGKKYVGSAYGTDGIWSRWACYISCGHGGNDELVDVINANGLEYARNNFKFSLLEIYTMKTDTESIIYREKFWKEVLLTRGKFGYNSN